MTPYLPTRDCEWNPTDFCYGRTAFNNGIILAFHTPDIQYWQPIIDYWHIVGWNGPKPLWKYPVDKITRYRIEHNDGRWEHFEPSPKRMKGIATALLCVEGSTNTQLTCHTCGKRQLIPLDHRTGVSGRLAVFLSNPICEECKTAAAETKQQVEADKRAAEKERQISTGAAAITHRKWEALSALEFNYLLRLIRSSGGTNEAAAELGISRRIASDLFSKLVDMGLVLHHPDRNQYTIPSELRACLADARPKRSVRPIFGSPMAEKCFRYLKQRHAFVYPEVPIAAFVIKEGIPHVFTESWHEHYFLSARVDFLVCEHSGEPHCAIEYNGSYHNDDERRKAKDAFKLEVLEAAGVPLQVMTAKDLNDEA